METKSIFVQEQRKLEKDVWCNLFHKPKLKKKKKNILKNIFDLKW